MRSNPAADQSPDPSVTVLVPCRNERRFIESCVRTLLEQRDRPARYDILVVDGMSDDGTREILARLADEDPRVRVFDNPRRIVSTALNIGIRASTSDVLIRVDGHARVGPGFVRANLQLLAEHPEAWVVGGPIAHRGSTAFARGVALAMSSWFGAGGARHRSENYQGYAESAQFPAIRRWVFARVGLFDEGLIRNQDDEFNLRITKAGGRIFISPIVEYEYYVREHPGALFRQYLQYGYWKVQVMRKHHRVAALRHLAPLVLVGIAPASLVAGLLAPMPVGPILLAPFGVYAMLAGAFFAVSVVRTSDVTVAASGAFAATTMHVAYGLGTLFGLLAPPGTARAGLRAAMERMSR
jgi:GT2 family glycosyltransferase